MEPNQQQPPRGDYTSAPAERPRNYVGALPQPIVDVRPPIRSAAFAPEQSSAESTPAPIAPQRPEPSPAPFMDVMRPSPQPLAQEAVVATTLEPVPEQAEKLLEAPDREPLLEAPEPEPLIEAQATQPPIVNDIAPAQSTPSAETPEAAAPPRPFQIAAPPAAKPAIWQTQRFWLSSSIVLFVLFLLLGSLAWYRATHHKPDATIPLTAVTNVDTDNTLKTVGTTPSEQAANKKRQQTVLKLRDAVEAYYTAKLQYPSISDMTNATWVTANLKGIKTDDLKDPTGVIATLVAVPVKNQYAYQAGADKNLGPCDNLSQNCNYYKVTTILSDGSEYSKAALR